jgi:hypothetical protein
MMQKAKRPGQVQLAAGTLAFTLPGYTVTVVADNGKGDRIEATSGPISKEGKLAMLFQHARERAAAAARIANSNRQE